MSNLAEPFAFEFFRRGLLAAVLVGGVAGLVGTYVVLRGMSYIGHGLSHAVFGGAVIAYVLGLNFYVGAAVWGLLAAWLIHAITRRQGIRADAAIGVVTTASFAVGVVLISRARRFTRNFEAALFGNILGVTGEDLWVIAGVSVAAVVLVGLFYKEFLYTTFDPESAEVYGVPTRAAEALLGLLLAAVVIAALQVIGVTMLAAALVTPAITARLLTERFDHMLCWSAGLGAATAAGGLYLSFALNAASGGTIVLVGTGVFGLVLAGTWVATRVAAARRRAPDTPVAAGPLHEHSHEHDGLRHVHPHAHPHSHDPAAAAPDHHHPDPAASEREPRGPRSVTSS
jgi:manganese/iron transport system permease protein/iron/zinc/copper transport system permease protein